MFNFRHLKSRIHAFVLTLLTVILVLVLLLVNRANLDNASKQIQLDISAHGNILLNEVDATSLHLSVAARLLSSDYAFKQAYATHEQATILSAMRNHLERLEHADVMMILDIDEGNVIADTLGRLDIDDESPLPDLLLRAEDDDYLEAVGYEVLDNVLYQFVVVPLLVPDPEAWIAIGFKIDDAYLQRFKSLSSSDVSIYLDRSDTRTLLASTLDETVRPLLVTWLKGDSVIANAKVIDMQEEQFLIHVRQLNNASHMFVVLQRSLDEALRPFLKLQFILLMVFIVGTVVAYLGSSWLARSVASPVRALAGFARRVEEGDYSMRAIVKTHDEISELASAFNHMTKGLEEKDKVRSLLGKVVSPEIAKQLIDHGVELGGEEKPVTVLFSDLRNFTSMCEGRSAEEILAMLNLYLNEMSRVVELNSGVVDKYIGDAMMALYGAPISSESDAANAVITALQMKDALLKVNSEFRDKGLPEVDIGIGINTDVVVAGNMGSATRLNYTVIGDGVNLAARLEGLTKFYGVKILVAASTMTSTQGISYREIDRVRVKGKTEPVAIYEPYSNGQEQDIEIALERYKSAFFNYQKGDWQVALELFTKLSREYPAEKLYEVYRLRCNNLLHEAPSGEWDGVYTFTSK